MDKIFENRKSIISEEIVCSSNDPTLVSPSLRTPRVRLHGFNNGIGGLYVLGLHWRDYIYNELGKLKSAFLTQRLQYIVELYPVAWAATLYCEGIGCNASMQPRGQYQLIGGRNARCCLHYQRN